jgi:PAS domain S-box-containing protein
MKGAAPEANASNKLDPRRVFLTDSADGATLVWGVEDDLRTVTAHTPFLLTRCSADLRYQFVNDAYARMLGLRATQIIGKPIGEIIGENAFKTILPHVQRALHGHRVEYESEIDLKSVGARSVRAIYTPERDSGGSIKGWVASIIDLTYHKVADTRLTAYRFSRCDGNCHDSAEHDAALPSSDCPQMVVSNPTVEIFPADIVRRRAIASHDMTAESVQNREPRQGRIPFPRAGAFTRDLREWLATEW